MYAWTTAWVKSINLGRMLGSMVTNTTEPETNTRSTASTIRNWKGGFVILCCWLWDTQSASTWAPSSNQRTMDTMWAGSGKDLGSGDCRRSGR